MTTKSKLAVMALGLALLGAAASVAQAQMRERVVYGLSWLPQAEHCGFFQARETGLYAAAGLDVELVPGGPGINTAQLVAAGRYHYAMGTALTTLNMRSNSVPGVTIAALFQKSPQTLVAHPGQGITKLEDLKTRRISVANFSRTQFWAWLKASHGFDDANLRPYTYNPSLFVADPSTVQQGFITEDAFFLGKALGAEPVSLLLADYGYPDYQTTIFTTDAEIAARPTVAQRFVDATIRGYAQCISGDPTPAFRAILAASAEQSPELSAFKIAQMKRYELVDGGDAKQLGIGAMTEARWKQIFDTMSQAGVYPANLDWKSAFKLDFVNRNVAAAR
ncbi:MAG: ABC transporter substrate-binding protein [Magnetospirillum sp.]|nr:ABC transporter substrate-binding protein [Magnetospirillum sp.]